MATDESPSPGPIAPAYAIRSKRFLPGDRVQYVVRMPDDSLLSLTLSQPWATPDVLDEAVRAHYATGNVTKGRREEPQTS